MADARAAPGGRETDALIVGAGPVGLTLALGLARQGTRCRIVDRDAGPSQTSRASELHARTLEVLDRLGVAEEVLGAGLVLRTVTFVSRGRPVAQLSTAGIDSAFPARLAIPPSDTERILESHLAREGVRRRTCWSRMPCTTAPWPCIWPVRRPRWWRRAGQPRSLRDVLRGPRHTLLVLAGEADAESRRGCGGLISRILGRFGDVMSGYLVRPDGYLGFRGEPPDPGALDAYLERLFQTP
jgi:hypothetical protein